MMIRRVSLLLLALSLTGLGNAHGGTCDLSARIEEFHRAEQPLVEITGLYFRFFRTRLTRETFEAYLGSRGPDYSVRLHGALANEFVRAISAAGLGPGASNVAIRHRISLMDGERAIAVFYVGDPADVLCGGQYLRPHDYGWFERALSVWVGTLDEAIPGFDAEQE